jgi:hypothetical protein
MSYGIGNKGASLLKRELALPFHRMHWKEKSRVGRLFLDHALLISDVMVALEMSCKYNENVRLLTGEEIPLSGNRGKSPSKWSVDIGAGLKCGVIPDRVFGLEIMEPSSRNHRSWFCLEADRATMPVIRGNFAQSSFYRKLLAYEATWAQDIHRSSFGWQRFRVLTVTSNPERIARMQEAARSLERGQGLFLFTDTKSLGAESDIFALRWQTCRKGETATLLD